MSPIAQNIYIYEERKKQLNSTTNVSISEEISTDLMISLLRLKHL